MSSFYFDRSERLFGSRGMEKLKNTTVIVIGLGGVGSHALEALVRTGVGQVVIVDHDRIEASNINRQVPARRSTIGQYKTDVMAKLLRDINPDLRIEKITGKYTAASSKNILTNGPDYVIDAIDSIGDKIHLIKTCLEGKIPIISSMGTANRINPMMFTIADIKDTSVCPMARRIRRELKQYGISEGLPVVYSREKPLQHGPDLGSVVYATASAGMLLAAFVINNILSMDSFIENQGGIWQN